MTKEKKKKDKYAGILNTYKQLYYAYENIVDGKNEADNTEKQESLNEKLIRFMGPEMKSIFKCSKYVI